MKKHRIKNPLNKRILRELSGDWKKYLLISLFLILTISYVSGMYVANGSMMHASETGADKYDREDGHFELRAQADNSLLHEIEADFDESPAAIYENFFRNESEDHDNDGSGDGTIRVYEKTDSINRACLMDGAFPQTADEIAIDRMHADNADIQVGDTITVGGEAFTVSGLLSYVNYYTLHEKSTDFMFDALNFDVAMVTADGFDRLGSDIHYNYAWRYDERPENDAQEKDWSDSFLETLYPQILSVGNEMVDYLPAYTNPAIHFATDDMGSDRSMGGVILDLLIAIIAFIFAVTISNTISREASAIGTLRASGYTRGELTRHYLAMPVLVTLFSALLGNILGYTVFKNIVVSMYYNSYSLPAYQTLWSSEAFIKTTLLPIVLMFLINLAVIWNMLRRTPLQFLRSDLKKSKRKKALRLPAFSFFRRFRLRIILQNLPNYIVLFAGILFVSLMLSLAVGMPETLDYYQEHADDMMLANYQYILKSYKDETGAVIQTSVEDAEAFSMKTLLRKGEALEEEISVYGISDDSQYVTIDELESLSDKEVYISSSFAEKYDLAVGDHFRLDEQYENDHYSFQVSGIYDKSQSIAVFMPVENYRKVFDLDAAEFTGYLSDTEITDIPDDAIATIITEKDVTKMADQLDHSVGAYMSYFQILCILLSAVLIYLLTKLIIEKNEKAISMAKILGYNTREIASLYLRTTTLIVLIFDAVCTLIANWAMHYIWKEMMAEYSGWFSFYNSPLGFAKMYGFVLIGYLLVMAIDFRRIQKIPLDTALKNTE